MVNKTVERRREEGVCLRCGKELDSASTCLCTGCLQKQRDYFKAYYKSKAAKSKITQTVIQNRAKPNAIGEVVRMAEEHGVSYGVMTAYLDGFIKELPNER